MELQALERQVSLLALRYCPSMEPHSNIMQLWWSTIQDLEDLKVKGKKRLECLFGLTTACGPFT